MVTRATLFAFGLLASVAAAQAPAKGAAGKSQPARPGYAKEIPDSLARRTKVTEPTAAATALAKVPNGRIQSVELEREEGKLLYSYDIKVPGRSGIEEVRVDAVTGTLVGKVEHESPAAEKKEAAADAKGKTSTTKTKKPPHPENRP
jgi:uncharacterized membrane protein YkoI